MLAAWVGALLVLSGLLTLAAPPIWRRHVSGRQPRPPVGRDSPETGEPWIEIDPEGDWPGIALVAMSAILLLASSFA
jgi:hypothetical protein